MRNLVDNMDLVEAAVGAVREPESALDYKYKMSLDALINIINSKEERLTSLEKSITMLGNECLRMSKTIDELLAAVRMLNDAQLYASYPRNQMYNALPNQPLNINWENVQNYSCGELIPQIMLKDI